MTAKLAPIFRIGPIPAAAALDTPRDRLVTVMRGKSGRPAPIGRTWLSEAEYRWFLRMGARMVVLEER